MKTQTRDTLHDCAIDTLREMSEILQALDIELDGAHEKFGTVRPERIAVLGDELRANHQFLLALTTHPLNSRSSLTGLN